MPKRIIGKKNWRDDKDEEFENCKMEAITASNQNFTGDEMITTTSTLTGPTWDAGKNKWKWVMQVYSSGGTQTPYYGCTVNESTSPDFEIAPGVYGTYSTFTMWLAPGGYTTVMSFSYDGNHGTQGEGAVYDMVGPCMVETITIADAVWNVTTGKWDYPVTITAEGGTPPYSPSRPSTQTVSLFPKESYTLSTSTSDSGSCSDSNSTVIGPAPAAPPVAGPCFESGTPTPSSAKGCSSGQPCTPTSGNNNVSGDSGTPQSYGNYAGGGSNSNSPAPTGGNAKPL